MDNSLTIVNKLMLEVFNDVLNIEETALKKCNFNDVSVTEVHTIEAIGLYKKLTMSEVARQLNITMGTLTVAVNNLEKKEYVKRLRSDKDRRVVKLSLTKKGRYLYRVHAKLHSNMIKASIDCLTKEEEKVLITALSNLHTFLSSSLDSKTKI